uniref:rRNA-processing protein FYV7 n=1 Tax=Panagrellus redivivus TaxID=6233 RepID=A0A7E4VE31_PANRE
MLTRRSKRLKGEPINIDEGLPPRKKAKVTAEKLEKLQNGRKNYLEKKKVDMEKKAELDRRRIERMRAAKLGRQKAVKTSEVSNTEDQPKL